MTREPTEPHRDAAATLRASIIALAALGIAGIGAELLIERHWGSVVRLIPWASLVALAWAAWLLWRAPDRRRVLRARALAGVVILAAVVGIWLHVSENYKAGPLDFRYENTWDQMSEASRWWTAFSKSVGPAPTLAPAALADVALLVLVATRRHPALRADAARVPPSRPT